MQESSKQIVLKIIETIKKVYFPPIIANE